MSKPKTLAAIFNAAADAIEKYGHAIGELRDSRGRMCLWGAVSFVVDGDPYIASTRTHKMLDHLIPFTAGISPIAWNNRHGRKKWQVVAMLRKAATALRGHHV